MGKIQYSIVPRVVNLAERIIAKKNGTLDDFEPEVKYYGSAQQQSVLSLEDFAAHISEHHSKYGKGDIYCVLTEMVTCMREQLLMGNKVCLGDLGSFYISLSTEGTNAAALFSAENIKKVNVRWSVGKDFTNLRKEANFELVPTRKAQSAAVAEAKKQ